MARYSAYGEASDRVEPPEPDYEFTIECPVCGAELHEGDEVYETTNNCSHTIWACKYCIDNAMRFVEDL